MSDELPRSDGVFKKLMETAGCMIVILREDHSIVYFSQFAERLTGYSAAEVLGKDYFPIFLSEEDQPGVSEELQRILAGGAATRAYENAVRCRDGSIRWFAWNAQRLDDYEGKPAVLAVGHDITERRQVEEALRERERHLRDGQARLTAILDTAVDGIITIDDQGVIESANRAAVQIFGYPEDKLVGQNVSLLMPSPYREEHDDYIKHYLQTGEKKIIGIGREVQGRRTDGSVFAVNLAVSEVHLGDRRMFTGIVRDISEKKEAEEQKELLAEAVRNLDEGVLITDAQLDWPGPRILFVNEAMLEITGYAVHELLGKTPRRLQGAKTNRGLVEDLRRKLMAGKPFAGELVNYRRDGTPYDVELFISPVMDTDGRVTNFVSIHRNITERKQAAQRVMQSERLAAIGEMVAGLAHESRNALQRSQACLEMLEMEVEDRPDALDLVQRVQQAQDNLHQLYEDVRGYAAPINLDRDVCNLAQLWRDTWSHLEVVRGEKTVQLREQTGNIDLKCDVDPFQLGQVFRNILENAINACPDPGEIVVSCEETSHNGRPSVQISFRDNGPGIEQDHRKRIFDPFFTTKTKGTGLGMAIAQRIVAAHDGQITLGECPAGAEFLVTLPRE